nr:retrotransposon protein, putative, Ty1-copia subclass [Tanacetum cinerariifolium]
MHANKSFNRNPSNHRLYHALLKALIEDENIINKGFAHTVQDHKRKHDDDKDDDDEDPPAGPNHGKAPSKGSKTGKSAPAKEPVEEHIIEVVMDYSGYSVSVPALTKDHDGTKIQYVISRKDQYAIFKPYGIKIFWKISNVSKYVLEILNKYGMESCDPVGTPMEIKDKLDLDQNGTPDSGFELTGFSDADYAGCKDTFKSTSGGAQFLGEKLVSWSSKKQDCTALSTAEAEYVSLSACCAQIL